MARIPNFFLRRPLPLAFGRQQYLIYPQTQMTYALFQTTWMRPGIAALLRAFATGRGLTVADARLVADDAFGLLARDLELDDALFLQQSLGAEGIEVQVVPESDVPKLPDPVFFWYLECSDEALRLMEPNGVAIEIPWGRVDVVAAGFDQRELRVDLIADNRERHYFSTLDRLEFDRMPAYIELNEPGNMGARFTKLIRDLVIRTPESNHNQAAKFLAQDDLSGDVTAAITYPKPSAYFEEIAWLLWKARTR